MSKNNTHKADDTEILHSGRVLSWCDLVLKVGGKFYLMAGKYAHVLKRPLRGFLS